MQNLSVDDTTKLHIDGDYTSRLSVTAVTLADVPNLDIFTDPLQMVNTRLGPLLSYNPLTHQLQYRGRMTQQDLYDLLNPQVYVVDLLTQCPVLDVNGLPVMRPVQLTTDIAAINNLFTASQDVPVSPLAYNGLQIGGPGKFDFMARNLDLGASAGIRSVAFLLNPSLAGVSLRGADLSVKLWGDLQMGSSQIASFGGGSIDVTAAGKMDIGSQEQYSGDDTPKGIYTAYGGHVSVEAGGNINVNGSRIASYDGGDVTVTSDGGSIDAGQGAKGFFYVATPQLDPQTKLPQVPPPNDRFFGSGIMALTRPGASSDAKVGNIKVTAAGDISANSSGVLQLAFNNVDQNGASLLLDAGKNIQANQSGVLGYNVKLNAKGNITGLVVAQQNLVVDAVKSVAVTALASGNASISGESVSGKVVAAGGIGVSGQQEGSLTVISASSPGGSGSTGGAFANVAAPAAPAKATETADKTLAAQPDSKSADEDPLLKNKKKAQLVRTVSRVTVILPKK